MVRYGFPRPDAEGYFAGFERAIDVLAKTRGSDRARAATLGDALATVLGIWLLSLQNTSTPWAGQRLNAFYARVLHALDEYGGDFAVYLTELDFALESETPTGWYDACFTRSVVEVLLREAGLSPAALVASDWVEATDEEMREAAGNATPLPAEVIPRNMPGEHWWWFAAYGTPNAVDCEY
ncbi:hypothetical protein ABZ565_25540 [Streptomyces sp. NPDC016469]|uniref:hypothetical protein n=1 Tax=Streptomyces sp. NPDC016469 TaxID=3157191 RepID=UPI0033D2A518